MHVAPVASVPPDRLTAPEPDTAVAVPPLQLPVRLLGFATTSPDGRVSVNATPLSARFTFGLLRVMLRPVVPFSGMLRLANPLEMVGGLITVRVAREADAALPAAGDLSGALLL